MRDGVPLSLQQAPGPPHGVRRGAPCARAACGPLRRRQSLRGGLGRGIPRPADATQRGHVGVALGGGHEAPAGGVLRCAGRWCGSGELVCRALRSSGERRSPRAGPVPAALLGAAADESGTPRGLVQIVGVVHRVEGSTEPHDGIFHHLEWWWRWITGIGQQPPFRSSRAHRSRIVP